MFKQSVAIAACLFAMATAPYHDNYHGAGAGEAMASPYNHSQPIDTVSAAADESVTNPAESLVDAGPGIVQAE